MSDDAPDPSAPEPAPTSADPPDDAIVRHDFPSGFRGFDPTHVTAHLEKVAARYNALAEREQAVLRQLAQLRDEIADARSAAAAHAADAESARADAARARSVLDEATIVEALGAEAAAILRRAHEAASHGKARAEAEAVAIVQQAHDDAAAIRRQAEQLLTAWTREAESRAAQIVAAAEQRGLEIQATAAAEAEELVAQGRRRSQEIVEDAQSTCEKVMGDLMRRRRITQVQIEQLRAGRERLLDAYRTVRRTLDEVTGDLQRSDAEARAAAAEVGRRAAADPTLGTPTAQGGSSSRSPSSSPAGPPGPAPAPAVARPRPPRRPPSPSPSPSRAVAPAAAPARADEVPVEVDVEDRPQTAVRILRPVEDEPVVDEQAEAEAEPEPEPAGAAAPEDAPTPEEAPAPDAAPPRADETPLPEEEPSWTEEVVSQPPVRPVVDQLFARLRAERGEAVARAQEILRPSPAPAAEAGEAAAPVPVPDSDEILLQQRDAALEGVEEALTRKLKRAMQDEQNDILDRLRGFSGSPDPARLLPAAAEQAARYRTVATPFLSEAAEAGGGFYPGGTADVAQVDDVAEQLAAAIVDPLRRRLETALREAAGDDAGVDAAAIAPHISAAYREWKTQRIEQVAGDHLTAAFAIGVLTSSPQGTAWRWVADDQEGSCPDCDDNALAGPTPRGEVYPTGQPHPPAHPGCRCLLVPARR